MKITQTNDELQPILDTLDVPALQQDIQRLQKGGKPVAKQLDAIRIPIYRSAMDAGVNVSVSLAEQTALCVVHHTPKCRVDYEWELPTDFMSVRSPDYPRQIVSRHASTVPESMMDAMDTLNEQSYRIHKGVFDLLLGKEKIKVCKKHAPIAERIVSIGIQHGKENPYRLLTFADFRGRLYTDDHGVFSYQGDDISKACCCFATPYAVTPESKQLFLDDIEAEWGITPEKYMDASRSDLISLYNDHGWKLCAIKAILDMQEVEKTGFSTRIHQRDATCSGPQHMSLLMRDRRLAVITNVLNDGNTTLLDLYMGVVEYAQMTKGGEQWMRYLAKQPDVDIRREIAKPTVLLSCYGSGIGALALRLAGLEGDELRMEYKAVRDELADEDNAYVLNPDHVIKGFMRKDASQLEILEACYQLAKLMRTALMNFCPAIREFLGCIRDASKKINSDDVSTVQWTAPSGLLVRALGLRRSEEKVEVIYNYRFLTKEKRRKCTVFTLSLGDGAAAAPPNVVHSIDATVVHEMILRAAKQGMPLCPIHDSFGCRICDIATVTQLYTDVMLDIHESYSINTLLLELGADEITLGSLITDDCRRSVMIKA